ncbi:unnamed protein product, partial [Prorocentrum cordatum]
YLSPRNLDCCARLGLGGHIQLADGAPTYNDAIVALTSGINECERLAAKDAAARWRAKFAEWSTSLWTTTTPMFRDTPPAACQDVGTFRQTWQQQWGPPNHDADGHLQRWRSWAANIAFPRSGQATDWLPNYHVFDNAVQRSKGAAGFDGWAGAELRLVARLAPEIMRELCNLRCNTTREIATDGINDTAAMQLFSWKIAGIPKNEDDSRPIAVGSCILRLWPSALAGAAPEPPTHQWSRRRATSATHAISSRLHSCTLSGAGSEHDLSKARDNIDFAIAEDAFERQGMPPHNTRLCMAAWRAPRFCTMGGKLSRPIWPKRGLPQGDSLAPNAMVGALAPWAPDSGLACMGDRGLTATDAVALAADVAMTTSFDNDVGFTENASKRQTWSVGDDPPKRSEHLGLAAGWAKIENGIGILHGLPGSFAVRIVLAIAYIRPRWTWAAPLLTPVPADNTKRLFRALLNARCTWWCRGRFWALHTNMHPQYSQALQRLLAVSHSKLVWGDFVQNAITAHAASLGLTFITHSDDARGAQLEAPPTDDRRVLQ